MRYVQATIFEAGKIAEVLDALGMLVESGDVKYAAQCVRQDGPGAESMFVGMNRSLTIIVTGQS